jgi:transposase
VGADHLLPTMAADMLIADKPAPAKACPGEGRGRRAFDADERVLEPPAAAGKAAVIPPRANRSSLRDYDRPLYGERHLIENFFAKIKQFRAIATRVACPWAGEAGPVGEDRAQLPGRCPPRRQCRLA